MRLRIAVAQINPTVGALFQNRQLLERRCDQARRIGADVVIFPELVLTGYPPEDLLTNPEFIESARQELEAFRLQTQGLLVVVGVPLAIEGQLINAAAVFLDGSWVDTYAKGSLPNYGVFDEKRYFRPGLRCPVYHWGDLTFGINICEDLWVMGGIPRVQAQGGARLLFNISSSPYHAGKGKKREALLRRRARELSTAIIYVNLVGGQDELVFDGASMAVDAAGEVRSCAPQFAESLLAVDVDDSWLDLATETTADAEAASVDPQVESIAELESQLYLDNVVLSPPPGAKNLPPLPPENRSSERSMIHEEEVYAALTLGLCDYAGKNGFGGVIIGLSGGIDSALTAAIAADALGPERVTGVSMPSRFNSPSSRQGARDVAANLHIQLLEIPIEEIYQTYLQTLSPTFAGTAPGVTEENIQARIRGNLLMALSNKWGSLVLTTGNKSELAVGYCTLYGDMAGGFAVIKDVPKTLVYKLAHYRNSLSPVIPEDTLDRAPSAELRENQLDLDRLPPYDLLDAIVEARMEREEDPGLLIARGMDPHWVHTVYRWIDEQEYKRRQAPPGIKITPRAFGRDRRYPITNRYRSRA